MKRLFGQYVSKDVYEQLVANPELARLGGQRRQMTVLFSDIRGFTTVSERGQPEEIVGMLNEYFTRMVEIVFAHKGTLDKFVGDMVMALFGAPLDDPNHAEHAVDAALEMIRELNRLNEKWAAEGRPALDIGIGISTGPMIAGNIGSEAIMSYTVIGDAVNLGARLESLNKQYGTRIIISEATRDALTDRYLFRPLGDVVVKGKTKPVAIFEVKENLGMKLWIITIAILAVGVAGLRAARRPHAQGTGGAGAQAAVRRPEHHRGRRRSSSARTSALKIRERFGVVQDAAVHKYVALVGTV